jgi:hypothetical protein
MNSCSSLFLKEIFEPGANCLRLIIREGKTSKVAVPIVFAGTNLGESFPVKIDEACATFQLDWNNYVLYHVLNESYGVPADATEFYEGKLARKYTASKLLQFTLASTCATDEYPGKLLHYEIICEQHVINVICIAPPCCTKLGSSKPLK